MTPMKNFDGNSITRTNVVIRGRRRVLREALLALIIAAVFVEWNGESRTCVSAFTPIYTKTNAAVTTTLQQNQQINFFSKTNIRAKTNFPLRVAQAELVVTPPKKRRRRRRRSKNKVAATSETATQNKRQWGDNTPRRVYDGTSYVEIAKGTEKHIANLMKKSITDTLHEALELHKIVQIFEKEIMGMDAEDVRRQFTEKEIEVAIANRQAFEEHMKINDLVPEDLQVVMQRLTFVKRLEGNL